MSTFLDAVNRVLIINDIIADDDDELTSFSSVQHKTAINKAKISIQSTLNELISDRMIPNEYVETEMFVSGGDKTKPLPSNFIRFAGDAKLLKIDGLGGASENSWIYEYPGGEEAIKKAIPNYKELIGELAWFYFEGGGKTIRFVPYKEVGSGTQWFRYFCQSEVMVENEADTMPFNNNSEFYAFVDMAARHFQFSFANESLIGLEDDIIYKRAKATLMALIRGKDPVKKYGYYYP